MVCLTSINWTEVIPNCLGDRHGQFWSTLDVDERDLRRPERSERGQMRFDCDNVKMDRFKLGLAQVWSLVRLDRVTFAYTTSSACDLNRQLLFLLFD